MKDLYKILGLDRNASIYDIKKAYKKLALKWHPDINKQNNAHNKFIEINEAYLILSDYEAKRKYDEEYDAKIMNKSTFNGSFASSDFQDYDNKNYSDEDLNTWSKNARKQGEHFASMTFNNFSQQIKSIFKETGLQLISALFYAVSGILVVKGFYTLILSLIEFSPEKLILSLALLFFALVGFYFTSKQYQ